ncbi:hypothetical protein SAMN05660337_0268 [Maridesulfovibrio ferrireducens]|uniref:Uncharacterized protein n=1 Tax=Maridesulfovibrio ferrireducens TaxID=246191 RepID=A0A1G9BEK9_9BACT|nr:hypothetical protein [Maridesulfovibrio ferrireducens]SDK37972.1 hypothetical protein SAMN05660337_0268 [Maridesulfovibrio ferrireducens]
MNHIKLTEKQLAIANSSGLTEEELVELLTGESLIPAELLEIVQKVAEQTAQVFEKEES